MVLFAQKWLYLGKSGCNLAKVVVFGQNDCIPANWLFSVKVVVFGKVIIFGKKCCIRAKKVVFGQSGCILAKVVVFGQSGCFRAKVAVFGQK